jgi:hypothetical protein
VNHHRLIKVPSHSIDDNFYYQCQDCLLSAWKDIQTFDSHTVGNDIVNNFLSSINDNLLIATYRNDSKEPFHMVYHTNNVGDELLYFVSTAGYALYIIQCPFSQDEWLTKGIIE